jgi:hypothetical protein
VGDQSSIFGLLVIYKNSISIISQRLGAFPRHQRRVRFLEQKAAKEMVKQHEMCPTKCGNYIIIYHNGDVIAS